jgi:hypothetical protein
MFSLKQNWRTRGQNRFCPEAGLVEGRWPKQCIFTHVSECKNNKILKMKKIKIKNKKMLSEKKYNNSHLFWGYSPRSSGDT